MQPALFQKSSGKRKQDKEDQEEFNSDMEDSDDDEETVENEEKVQGIVDHTAELNDLENEGKHFAID